MPLASPSKLYIAASREPYGRHLPCSITYYNAFPKEFPPQPATPAKRT
jgi:hypothetical protein